MKKYKIIFLFLILTVLLNIYKGKNIMASNIPNYKYLPIGTNYLDGNNLIYTYTSSIKGSFSSINNFKVKGGIYYKIVIFPWQELIFSEVFVKIYEGDKYISNAIISYQKENTEALFYIPEGNDYIMLSFTIEKDYGCDISIFDLSNYMLVEGSDFNTDKYEGIINYEGPIFELQEVDEIAYYYAGASEKVELEKINNSIIVLDKNDGIMTESKNIILDEYSQNIGRVGVYKIKYTTTDLYNNESNLTLYVNIKDDISPIINGKYDYYVMNDTLLDVNEILKGLSAVDNYDTDLTDDIELFKDSYSSFYKIPGTYDVLYRVFDSSQNVGYYKVVINVVEHQDEAPIFSGIFSYKVKSSEKITIEEIISNIVVTDNEDGDITENVWIESDGYSFGTERVGTWYIILGIYDSFNNKTYQTITINVIDDQAPKYYVDPKNIYIEIDNNNLSVKDFVSFLVKTKYIDESASYVVLTDTYSDNKKNPGKYNLSMDINDELYNLEIVVKEKKEIKINNFFSKVLYKIKSFFQRIKKIFNK